MFRLTVAAWAAVLVVASNSNAAPISLQNATATYTDVFASGAILLDIGYTIDGVTTGLNGWEVDPQEAIPQTAVYETTSDVGDASGGVLTITLIQQRGGGSGDSLARFRLSVTTDDRNTFADSLSVGGDVTAGWVELTPATAVAANGSTLSIQGDNSVLASGTTPIDEVYTVTAPTSLTGITGLRLEALLGSGGFVGRASQNGNFLLNEITVDYTSVPEPSSFVCLVMGGFLGLVLRRRRRVSV